MVGECRAGRGRAGGREVEEESAGRWKKWGKIMQQCLILCNRKWAKGRKPKKKKVGWKPEIQGIEGKRFGSPAPLPSKHSVYQIICRCGCSEVLRLY